VEEAFKLILSTGNYVPPLSPGELVAGTPVTSASDLVPTGPTSSSAS